MPLCIIHTYTVSKTFLKTWHYQTVTHIIASLPQIYYILRSATYDEGQNRHTGGPVEYTGIFYRQLEYSSCTACLPLYLSTYLSIDASIHGSTALVDLSRFFNFLIYTQSTVGLLGRGISPSQGRYLYTEQHKHRINAHRHLCLGWASNPRFQCSNGRRRFMS
jgi:hypothetical protein